MTGNAVVRGVLVLVAASGVLAATASGVDVQDLSGTSDTKRQDAKTASGTRGNTDNGDRVPRTDAKSNPVRVAKATGHVSNYSEDKVRPYTLPDPLVTASGQRIASAEQWFKTRRPEILKFYREEIYGGVPADAPGSPGRWPKPTRPPARARQS